MIGYLRGHIGVKLFLSYLFVIIVGTLVLAIATTFVAPSAFSRHLASMEVMMGSSGMMGSATVMDTLFINYEAAVQEALTWAALAAVITAMTASVLVTRRLIAPLRQITRASQRIAEGEYSERVRLYQDAVPGEMDELSQLTLTFNQMAENLEQTESIRRQLIGDVAHELRTPLTTIKGSMEGLIDGVLPPTPETYQQVYKEADRLQRLVNDLQELSRVEAGADQLNLAWTSIPDLVAPAAERLSRQFREKGVALTLAIPADLPAVHADPDRITQVLTNLLGNALQYTPEGGSVEVLASKINGEIAVSVRDSGVGISPEHHDMIFSRFYRIDKSRSRPGGGSGIGLTIAKHLVEAHGGRIWVESPGPGRGSAFTFTLPLSN